MPVLVGSSSREIALRATTCATGRGCLARRSPVGPRNIGRVRLGRTRKQVRRLPGLVRRTRRSYRFCVKGGRGVVSAVFSKRGRSLLVTTTAPAHGNRGVSAGRRSLRLRRAYPRRRAVIRGVYRASPRTRRLIGIRGRKVRFIAVAEPRLIRKHKALEQYLRLAGVTPRPRRRSASADLIPRGLRELSGTPHLVATTAPESARHGFAHAGSRRPGSRP
jgi:hypothetical protein